MKIEMYNRYFFKMFALVWLVHLNSLQQQMWVSEWVSKHYKSIIMFARRGVHTSYLAKIFVSLTCLMTFFTGDLDLLFRVKGDHIGFLYMNKLSTIYDISFKISNLTILYHIVNLLLGGELRWISHIYFNKILKWAFINNRDLLFKITWNCPSWIFIYGW